MFKPWFFWKFLVKSIYKKITIPAFAIIALTTGLLVVCQPQEIASLPQQETFTTIPVVTQTLVTSKRYANALALEYANKGIRVNGMAPGATITPINEEWVNDTEKKAIVESHISMNRAGTLEEVATPVAFLA